MAHVPQIRIPAAYLRGGTSKGVFFRLQDLPDAAQAPGAARDALLLRVIGSPDKYGKQTSNWQGVDVNMNLRPGKGVLLQGGTDTGRAVTDNCEILAKLPTWPWSASSTPARAR